MAKKTDQGLLNREIALDILSEVVDKGVFSHKVLSQALEKYQYFDKADRAFITRLALGTLERLITVDAVLDGFIKTDVGKLKPVIRNILRLGVYQLLYMDRVPAAAVCNEAVKLTKKRKFTGLAGFVNGVLRSVARGKGAITFEDEATRLSLPGWLYAFWCDTYGTERARCMGEAFLLPSPSWVRVNESRADVETVTGRLYAEGVSAQEGCFHGALKLSGVDYPEALSVFREGLIVPQDLSSILAGSVPDVREGALVIDACAAPGGKSLHIADRLKGTGLVEARDLSETKAALINENAIRCGFKNIRVSCMDARLTDEASLGKADLVIADLPCSGLGVIGRKSDIKYRVKAEDLIGLARLQRELLRTLSAYVKPGGQLLYCTCTVNPAENEENARWITGTLGLEPVSLAGRLPQGVGSDTLKEGYVQLFPGEFACDGFFISLFEKRVGL